MYGFISGLSKRCNEMDWGVTVTVPDLPDLPPDLPNFEISRISIPSPGDPRIPWDLRMLTHGYLAICT